MPRRTYNCPKCGIIEKIEGWDLPPKVICDKCGKEVKRIFSSPTLIIH